MEFARTRFPMLLPLPFNFISTSSTLLWVIRNCVDIKEAAAEDYFQKGTTALQSESTMLSSSEIASWVIVIIIYLSAHSFTYLFGASVLFVQYIYPHHEREEQRKEEGKDRGSASVLWVPWILSIHGLIHEGNSRPPSKSSDADPSEMLLACLENQEDC